MELELIKNCKKESLLTLSIWIILVGYLTIFFQGRLQTFDTFIYAFLHVLTNETLTQAMIFITNIGSVLGVVFICFLCLCFSKEKGLFISGNVICVVTINHIIKYIIARPRPSVTKLVIENGFSFPSAHAMVSCALWIMIAYFLWQKHRLLAVMVCIIPMLIGITRIYLGVHYATDVIGGYLFALTYLSTVFLVLKYHKKLPES